MSLKKFELSSLKEKIEAKALSVELEALEASAIKEEKPDDKGIKVDVKGKKERKKKK